MMRLLPCRTSNALSHTSQHLRDAWWRACGKAEAVLREINEVSIKIAPDRNSSVMAPNLRLLSRPRSVHSLLLISINPRTANENGGMRAAKRCPKRTAKCTA